MKQSKLILITITFLLCSCAGPAPRTYDPVAQQCEYESVVATSGPGNPLVLGWRRGELYELCMRAKGR